MLLLTNQVDPFGALLMVGAGLSAVALVLSIRLNRITDSSSPWSTISTSISVLMAVIIVDLLLLATNSLRTNYSAVLLVLVSVTLALYYQGIRKLQRLRTG